MDIRYDVVHTDGVARRLVLERAANVRDLGGFALPDGGRTRSCVLLRSDAVHQLSERDVALLVGEWGLRHVIDLRAPGEPSYRWTDRSYPDGHKAKKSKKSKRRTTKAKRPTS